MACPPFELISWTMFSAAATLRRYAMTTLAPCAAIIRAVAAPMPRPPPIIRATFPSSVIGIFSLSSSPCFPDVLRSKRRPQSGRQDTGSQPLHQVLSKLLIRFVEWIIAKELAYEHPLKTWPQQQGSNAQSRDMLPDAPQLLLLLARGFTPFKDVLWSQFGRQGCFLDFSWQFRVD